MQRKSSRFLIITTALALSACGSSTTSTASGGSDASIDSGPVGIQDTGIAAPTQFTCTSASKNAAGFSWQASPTPGVVGYVVERATLSGEFEAQPGVGGKTLTFADLTVTQFETYRYRVRAKVADKLGDSSNEVTVGAPAPGFHTAVGPGALATDVDLALDGNGDPAIVYVASDTPPAAVVFSNWNRKTAAWNAPVKITSDFLPNTSGGSPVAAIAFDHAGSSGTFAVVWASADGQQLDWALSSDAGKTWQQETIAVSPAGTSYAQPAIALGNSKAHVTWLQDGVRLFYATGTLSTPAKNWTADKEAPPAATADKLLPFAPSIALDAAQAPAIAYFSHGKDESVIATFWRPDEKNARTIQSSGGYADPSPSLSLAFKGQAPRAAVTLHQSPTTNAAVWFVTSSDGNSWGTPLALPVDGAASGQKFTRLVTSSKDVSAITYDDPKIGGSGGKCGNPKLALTTDGVAWTTCSPDTAHSRADLAASSRIALGNDGKRWLAWQNLDDKSVVVWREP